MQDCRFLLEVLSRIIPDAEGAVAEFQGRECFPIDPFGYLLLQEAVFDTIPFGSKALAREAIFALVTNLTSALIFIIKTYLESKDVLFLVEFLDDSGNVSDLDGNRNSADISNDCDGRDKCCLSLCSFLAILSRLGKDGCDVVLPILCSLLQSSEPTTMESAYVVMAYIIECFSAEILPDLQRFSAILIQGTNHPTESVRVSAMFALRPYVRLEPVAKMGNPASDVLFDDVLQLVTGKFRRVCNLLDEIDCDRNSSETSKAVAAAGSLRGYALRRYQWEAVLWIARLWSRGFGGAILADEQGLGKTLTAVAAIAFRRYVGDCLCRVFFDYALC